MTKHWQVLKASVNSIGGLAIEGINHFRAEGADRAFYWNINFHSLKNPEYDFSGCNFAPGALARKEELEAIALRASA
jgi:hypothetical protein